MPNTVPRLLGMGLGSGDVSALESGDSLVIRAVFDRPVRVRTSANEPSIGLTINGTTRRAVFHRVVSPPRFRNYGSNVGSAIEFAYTMQASDAEASEITVTRNSLRTTGGTSIVSATGGSNPALGHSEFVLRDDRWNAEATSDDPLTATFESVPSSHDGETGFSLQVQFSEAIATGYEAIRDDAFTITNGEVTNASRVNGQSDLWKLDIEPDSDTDVTLSVAADRECTESGALCTGDERSLSNALEATIAGPQETTALTAAFRNVPASHDGANEAFDVRILFDTRLSGSWTAIRDAISVTNATHTSTRRVDGRSDLWKIGINPTSTGDVTVTLAASPTCGETGAMCDADNRRFESAVSTTIPYATAALTAAFEGMPSTHNGSTAFTFKVRFSEGLTSYSYATLRDHSVRVTQGGTTTGATSARRMVSGKNDYWEVTATPNGSGDISIALGPTTDCEGTGAMCAGTADNRRPLSSALRATIAGPPQLSIADATVEEAANATVDFEVAVSKAASSTVTVSYATSDGSALAGSDYIAASGTLTFAPGALTQTIAVTVLADSLDEDSETFNVTLSGATGGAWLSDATATGTITNSDPMPRAWLTRFGRTVASQAVDAIGNRINGKGSSHVQIAGMTLSGEPRALEEETEGGFGLEQVEWQDREQDLQSLSPNELLLGSTFQLSSGGESGAPQWTAWGQFATGSFEAEVDDTKLDGNVRSGFLGADISGDRWLGGLALSMSSGDGDFSLMDGDDTGEVESTLTSVYPYGKVGVNDKVDVWGMVGFGTGDITLTQHPDTHRRENQSITTDIDMRMGAIGMRGEILSPEEAGVSITVKSDAFLVQMKSDAVRSDRGNLAATKSDASRVRLAVEGARTWETSGGNFTPSVEIGVRHDGGDAETGTGVELGGGFRYEGAGVSIEGAVRTLIAHEEDGYEEWGASGTIRIDPGASGRGLSLTLAPSWGNASSGMDQIWSPRDAHRLSQEQEFEAESRVEGEIGYGLSLSRIPGVLTPYAGMTFGEAEQRAWRTGARWQMGTNAAVGLEANSAGEGTGVALRARLRF